MTTRVIHARVPAKIGEGLEQLVEEGYYTSVSDAMRDGARHMIMSHRGILKDKYPGASSVEMLRESWDELWKETLKMTDGDEKKAAQIIIDKANAIEI